MTQERRVGKYGSFAELAAHERPDRDFRITHLERAGSPVAILAPHGGLIEDGTSEIAALIAGTDHALFCFEGMKPYGHNRDLHITSHRFDHPDCIAMVAPREVVVSVHGCRGDRQIFLGGLDRPLTSLLERQIAAAGYDVLTHGHQYPGLHPSNICNRGVRRRGAQIEITQDLRSSAQRIKIADAARAAIGAFLEERAR
ncbi:MAG: hypothetical protein NVSMB10_05780 [Steroidobacteraceae bacterium]